MDTPIADFVRAYQRADMARLHMPGHKGRGPLGCEGLDISEVNGADALYEAEGIIARSEENASRIFGSAATLYSTEGSSQCIRAMLRLVTAKRPRGARPVILAARNAHKAFVYAAALLDFDVIWLPAEGEGDSLCSQILRPERLERALAALPAPPAAVYVTSPDYLGGQADISAMAEICHRHETLLAVDNAHGAYLHFLPAPAHPLDLGADICCDSAHKTLPVLTGGAYLHIGKNAPADFCPGAKAAMALFGSTSPSYLTLSSLDLCNKYLAVGFREKLAATLVLVEQTRRRIENRGWHLLPSDPLRLTLAAPVNSSGTALAHRLRDRGVECEFSDPDFLVLMATPENPTRDFSRLLEALGENGCLRYRRPPRPAVPGERIMSVRQALLAPHRSIPAEKALGRVCAGPSVSCPPAVPIAVPGELICTRAAALFEYYGIKTVDVVCDGEFQAES